MRRSRTLITDQTRRFQGTNRAALTAVVVIALLVGTLYIWPQATQIIDDGILLGIFGGVLLVGTMVVALMLYVRPEPLVSKAPKDLTTTERRFLTRLRRTWARDTRAAGLTIDEPLDDGSIYVEAPHITSIERVALGLRMTVRVVPGISADKFIDATPGLASAVGSDLRPRRINATTVELTVELRDALSGIRAASAEASPRVTVGRRDDGTDAVIDLREASHLIIQGITRSGKSALCYVLLAQIALSNIVRVGGVDPNRVLLSPLAQAKGPERFVLGSDVEAAAELLERYVALMDDRLTKIDRAGVDKIDHFTEHMPVEVVVLEEYGALLRQAATEDRAQKPQGKTSGRIKSAVARLVSEGAKAGIRLILIIQRADAEIVDGATRGQFGSRITMAVDNADAVRMLHPTLTAEEAEPVTRFPAGRCLFWQDKTTNTMQGDLCSYSEYRARLGLAPAHTEELENDDADSYFAH